MQPKEFDLALRDYAALSPADRNAVARRLSPAERESLNQIVSIARRSPGAAADQRSLIGLTGYSPWLAHRLRRIIELKQSRPAIPPAARAALLDLLTAGSGVLNGADAPFKDDSTAR